MGFDERRGPALEDRAAAVVGDGDGQRGQGDPVPARRHCQDRGKLANKLSIACSFLMSGPTPGRMNDMDRDRQRPYAVKPRSIRAS